MPWNDNANPGPWGAPHDRGAERPEPPPRPPPAPPPPPGPDLEKWLQRGRRGWDRLVVQPLRRPPRPSTIAIAIGALAAIWILSGFSIVRPGQRAILSRFGAFEGLVGPGLAYHLPAPIGGIEKIDVAEPHTTLIGAGEPLLTRDGGLAAIAISVQWRVADPLAYRFHIHDPGRAIRLAVESAMRQVAGGADFTALAGSGRAAAEASAAALTQAVLDHDQAGVSVLSVRIQNVSPPAGEAAAFQDVIKAGDDAKSAIAQARADQVKEAGDAADAAAKLLQAADDYRAQTVLEAQGEAARFGPIEAQYRRAPALTRERLYIQTMQRVLSRAHVIIIGGKAAGAPVMLPPQALAPAAPAPPPPAAGPSSGGG